MMRQKKSSGLQFWCSYQNHRTSVWLHDVCLTRSAVYQSQETCCFSLERSCILKKSVESFFCVHCGRVLRPHQLSQYFKGDCKISAASLRFPVRVVSSEALLWAIGIHRSKHTHAVSKQTHSKNTAVPSTGQHERWDGNSAAVSWESNTMLLLVFSCCFFTCWLNNVYNLTYKHIYFLDKIKHFYII